MNMDVMIAGTVCFVVHALIGAIDGAYYHLKKYKLYTHEESLFEHKLHTLRAVFLSLTALLLFTLNSAGWLLWTAALIIVVDLVVLAWDVLIERRSREKLGGLSSKEYLVHVLASVLHAAGLALALAAKPCEAWSLSSPATLEANFPILILLCGGGIAVVTAVSSIEHFWYWQPKYRESAS
jgi:phosphatidylglycerophosphate synthase